MGLWQFCLNQNVLKKVCYNCSERSEAEGRASVQREWAEGTRARVLGNRNHGIEEKILRSRRPRQKVTRVTIAIPEIFDRINFVA